MDLDVALDPLGAHGKVWTPLTCITHAIARSHTDTLRRALLQSSSGLVNSLRWMG